MAEDFLRLQQVTKAYAGKVAVNEVNLAVPHGGIYGLLGPNGAGKTSIIRMITSITAPDSGEIFFNGEPLKPQHSEKIGYMPEERGLYKKMKVREHLIYLMRLKGNSKQGAKKLVDEWMEEMEIQDWRDKKVGDLSKGMQQKVQFIATVAHKPSLLILDEPFSGLDPINTQLIEDKIRELNQGGTTLIFSTHRMEQVEELCDTIALINNGKVILQDPIDKVRKQFQKDLFHIGYSGDGRELEKVQGVEVLELEESKALIGYPVANSGELLRAISTLELDVTSFSVHQPRLQEIFIEMVQRKEGSWTK